jgi:hypothetical protein
MYQQCVELSSRKYWDRFGAIVDPRPDVFVTAHDQTRFSPTVGLVLGLAGLTSAEGRKLLSENYLEAPVEEIIAQLGAAEPDRRRIAQMGPVVSFFPGCGLFLISNMPLIAASSGFDYLISTLTERLHGITKDAGWDFRTLTNARRADLVGDAEWGSYYSTRPRTGILHCGQLVALPAAS